MVKNAVVCLQFVYRDNGIELYEYYKEDGTLKTKISIKDGIRNGPAVYYYSNGNIRYKLIYKDGKKEGPYESYYLTGELSAKGAYKDDKKPVLGNFMIKKEI